ncbi:MAG: 6-phospho-beta-glucosidase [Deltaproteobacteria bacterium]|nr:6-phospho-beta-glucosidase [Deltaproteobacteria bacterium]
MKLVLVGGGGIRTPLFIDSLLGRMKRWQSAETIDALTLHDVQESRLRVMDVMGRHILEKAGSSIALSTTTNLEEALEGADFVVTTLRAGMEQGRIIDEKVPLAQGCIGQETVGAGGYAMAMRSIPAVLEVARTMRRVAPKAWIINFTNPASLVTQALVDAGFDNAVGICDSADSIARDAGAHLGFAKHDVKLKVFGLNHCSFTREAMAGGEDILPKLLADDRFLDHQMALYDKSLLREIGVLPNEYLYYYFYPEKAYEGMAEEAHTRGEQVLALNTGFFKDAFDGDQVKPAAELLRLHHALVYKRNATYMDYAWKETAEGERPPEKVETGGEGYAGVALDFIEARLGAEAVPIVLNYRNMGAIPFFAAHEVAELTYMVGPDTFEAVPVPPEAIHPKVEKLLRQVRYYETLAAASSRYRSRRAATWALQSNPLVASPDKASAILDGFAQGHGGVLAEMAQSD